MDQEHGSSLWAKLNIPARIPAQTVGKLLGFAEHDISILMGLGLLKPLGNPAQNATKWFSTSEVLRLGDDKEWLDKATKRLSQYWMTKRRKNSRAATESHCNIKVIAA